MKGTRGKSNEQLFPKQVVIQLPKIYKIETSNRKEPQQKYRLSISHHKAFLFLTTCFDVWETCTD